MKRILIAVLCAFFMSYPIIASSPSILSPALNVIAQNKNMIKSEVVSCSITFSGEDFERSIGGDIDYITITALPPESQGTLTYAGVPVSVNQTISYSGLSELKFVPSDVCTSTSFRFKAGQEYSFECQLKYNDSVNLAPTSFSKSDISVWTQQDISTYGTLYGSDPEGDEIVFEIVEYPKNGILEIIDISNGDYRYTPYDGVTGDDSFVYTVRDDWGNYSDKRTITVDIDRAASELVFADMDDHWAHNAALVMVAENSMSVKTSGGEMFFCPDEEMTREDFLVTVMKALGSGEIEPCMTIFADHSEISAEATGYINRAYELGIIKGSEEDGLICFNPTDKITRAEAAVILNSIIGAETPQTVPVFSDSSAVPAWAKSSLYALTSAGIFRGTGSGNISPNEVLSRAQTAQILLKVKQIYS